MPFAWTDGPVPLLGFDAPAGFAVAFSSRLGGVSEGPFQALNLGMRSGDDTDHVAENRRRAVIAAGGDPQRASSAYQRHSGDVLELDPPAPGSFLDPEHRSPAGDGLVTEEPEQTLVAFGADCLTVALCAPEGGRVAVVHAGWKGLLEGVLERGLVAVGGAAVCAVGPAAGACCYDVRDDVGEPLRSRFGADAVRNGRADLPLCAERALRGAGAREVEVAGICTICDRRFFSHRRDGEPGGRHGVLARRTA